MPCGVGYYKNVGLSDDLFTAQARLRLLRCTAWKAKFGKLGFLSVINRSILHLRAFLVPGISRLPLYVSPLTPTDRAMAVCFMALSSLGRSRRGQTVRYTTLSTHRQEYGILASARILSLLAGPWAYS